VEKQLFAREICLRFVDPEDSGTFGVKNSLRNQVVDGATWLECRIKLQEGFRPKRASLQFGFNPGEDHRVRDLDEAPGVVGVVAHQTLTKIKDVHASFYWG
jgi:hypothetical protein